MIKLYRGNCLDIMPTLPDRSVDMILADLPYGTTQCKWDSVIDLNRLWLEYKRVIKDNGAIVLFGSEPFSSVLRISNLEMYKYDWIWEKPKGTGHLNSKRQPMRYTEAITVFYKKQCNYYPQKTIGHKPSNISSNKSKKQTEVYGKFNKLISGGSTERYPKNIIKFNNVNSAHKPDHPTQKPVDLLEYLIKTYTNEGEVVLDNTMGSGSTGVSCVNTDRNFIGIEKDCPKDKDKHFRTAIKRITEAGGRGIEVIE